MQTFASILLILSSLVSFSFYETPTPCKQILAVGNSITRTPPNPSIGWYNDWGMAASSPDQDWAHQVQAGVAERETCAELTIERMDVPWVDGMLAGFVERTTGQRYDLIVVQTGDNAPAVDETYLAGYRLILDSLPGHDRLVLLSEWSRRAQANAYIQQLAGEYGGAYVDISPIAADNKNRAYAEWGQNAVGWHPGDRGMAEIAGAVLDFIYPRQAIYIPLVVSR
jgi:hypothetical protein